MIMIDEEIRAILIAIGSAARYGARIRMPHATIMTFLFRNDLSADEKLVRVAGMVWEHSSNLASFAAIYKLSLFTLKWCSKYIGRWRIAPGCNKSAWFREIGRAFMSLVIGNSKRQVPLEPLAPAAGRPCHPSHSMIAGAIGGYFVWGKYSSLNYQILLYLSGRVAVGIWKNHLLKEGGAEVNKGLYPVVAAAIWGVVMTLFEETPHVLQPSLRSSMEEIYHS